MIVTLLNIKKIPGYNENILITPKVRFIDT